MSGSGADKLTSMTISDYSKVPIGRIEMRLICSRLMMLVLLVLLSISAVMVVGRAQKFENGTLPQIPKTWDDKAVAELEVPLADPRYSPVHVSSDYYYRMPVRQIYKSYLATTKCRCLKASGIAGRFSTTAQS